MVFLPKIYYFYLQIKKVTFYMADYLQSTPISWLESLLFKRHPIGLLYMSYKTPLRPSPSSLSIFLHCFLRTRCYWLICPQNMPTHLDFFALKDKDFFYSIHKSFKNLYILFIVYTYVCMFCYTHMHC